MSFTRTPLTPKQKELLDYLQRYFDTHEYFPTIREIATAFTCSTSTIQDIFHDLEAKRYIKREKYKHRSIRIYKQK